MCDAANNVSRLTRDFNDAGKKFTDISNGFEWIGKSAAVLTILIKQVLLQLYRLERVLK